MSTNEMEPQGSADGQDNTDVVHNYAQFEMELYFHNLRLQSINAVFLLRNGDQIVDKRYWCLLIVVHNC